MSSPLEDGDSRTFQLLRRAKSGGLTVEQQDRLRQARSSATDKEAAILVADDFREIRVLVVQILHSLGYANIAEAADGQAALELLQTRAFDLVLLDIDMPRLNGFEVLAILKRDPTLRHVPVIVASGLDHLDAVVRCIELGATDFLPKPVNAVLLGARVAASLERKRLLDLERLRHLELQEEKKLLEIEQEKSERLLLNILPRVIAARLKDGAHTIADRHAAVTVLFADLVDFVSLANRMDPHQLVELLNDLFSRFDRLALRHGLEKIKTIGDCYLVAGGLPEARASHAQDVARMALEMQAALADLNRKRGLNLSLRIGINSGPVVAGVIGHQKFTYDLWGATVNLANRVEEAAEPGQISVAAATYELLQGQFRFTDRGSIACKGIGDVRTYALEGPV